jgi:predicted AlkP superfamily phosphohydrolase/phosphomutase
MLMAGPTKPKISRRTFLKRTALAAAAGAAAVGTGVWLGSGGGPSRSVGKKVIVIGIDGMDPRLCETMMREGLLPNLKKMRDAGGYSRLGTSCPPQSPVAWANFINGAGPGSHGIFDFIHRHPHHPTSTFYGAAETLPGEGYWEVDEHRIPLDRWPFNHRPTATVLRRQGVPFWDFLDAAGVPSTFFDLPCNYPPSPSHHGHHRCLAGMGTPDLLGTYGTYQYFAENGPEPAVLEHNGWRSKLRFEGETARATLVGPADSLRRDPSQTRIEFLIHRDREANAAVLEIQGRRVVLAAEKWSRWVKLDFRLSTPWFIPSKRVSGLCRFYLQEVAPNFRLFATPINIDPSDPAAPVSEPGSFAKDISERLGLFPTVGFQEAYEARKYGILDDDEFRRQADTVLEDRLALFEYALNDYEDGLLFFYFSSSDLQSHIFWWDSDELQPARPEPGLAQAQFQHVRRLYQRLDGEIGKLVRRYGGQATILVMSDHGFANFGRQFNLNAWLRLRGDDPDSRFLWYREEPPTLANVDWSKTAAYGLGLNGLYLNLKGREPHGIIEPGEVREALLQQLVSELEAVVDEDRGNHRVIRKVYRADQIYSGSATALAPDLIIGYARGYRISWGSAEGDATVHDIENNSAPWIENNTLPWSADHCADALEVPGVLFCNRPLRRGLPVIGASTAGLMGSPLGQGPLLAASALFPGPSLVDVAPSILAEFGLPVPSSMVGHNLFG